MQALDARFFFSRLDLDSTDKLTSSLIFTVSILSIFSLLIYFQLSSKSGETPRSSLWCLINVLIPPFSPSVEAHTSCAPRSAEQSCLPNPSVEAQQQQQQQDEEEEEEEEKEQLRDKPPAKPHQILLLDPPHPHPNRPLQSVHRPHEHPCSACRL